MPVFYAAFKSLLVFIFGQVVGTRLFIRLPLLLAGITLMVSLTITYFVLSHGLIDLVGQSVPTVVSHVWGWVMPSNANTCLLAIGMARLARWAHDRGIDVVKLKTKILAN